MDPTSPPTKPPRGVKSPKETSGLLMSVIRTLSTSESNEQRDKEKAKLEREYKKSDQQLNELVSLHNEDLTHVMQLFGKMSTIITSSKDKLLSIKENLLACKQLLSCRRDELKKLWVEGVEHKYVLQLLEEIEQLREVPSKLDVHLANKQYLQGTKVLVSALDLGEGTLEGVEALRELKNELQLKKEKLYQKLLEELSHEVYLYSEEQLEGNERDSTSLKEKPQWSRKMLDSSETRFKEERMETKEPSNTIISTVIECLALLKKLPEAFEEIQYIMQTELFGVVNRVSKFLVANPSEGIHPLLDLLDVLTKKLRQVANNHQLLLSCFSATAKAHSVDVPLFQMINVWFIIQAVLQVLLSDYLDIHNTASRPQQIPALCYQPADISSYFTRRRPQRPRKIPLFKFEYSANAVNSDSYLKEQSVPNIAMNGYIDCKQRERLLVCSPDPYNITIIFVLLTSFIEEIEKDYGPGSSTRLDTFVTIYVREVFLGREQIRILGIIEAVTKTAGAWRNPTPVNVMTEIGVSRPLLQSTVHVSNAINDMEGLLYTLSLHKEKVLYILLGIIQTYTETCQAAYRGIVQPEPEDKRLCSAAWLKDEDINRFLKSLPNWIDLQAQRSVHRVGKALKREDTVEEESPEDVRQRNMKEAEILATNLGEGGIGLHEIISDPNQLKCLALLQESMEWFAWRIMNMSLKLKKSYSSGLGNNAAASSAFQLLFMNLQNAAVEFEDLANTCLLVLHLEVRVQCFHYLLPKGNANGRSGGNAQDPDPRVLDLSRVLISIDDALSSSLQQRKMKYVFEGLGHLIAKILMSSTQFVDKIDECAIHKMCRNIFTLQQTLTNITMAREVALDHARHYFQLFFLTPEEILNAVLEKGPEFSELEYMNAFQLINRSYNENPSDQGSLQRHLQRLSDILGEVGVTV